MAHLCALLAFIGVSSLPRETLGGFARDVVRCAAGIPAIVCAALAFVPRQVVGRLVRESGNAWVFAAVTEIAIWQLRLSANPLWDHSAANPLTAITFRSVRAVLDIFLPRVEVDPATFSIGSPDFQVRIEPACSGVEGLVLILIFTAAWLWFLRREFLFPRALLLIPVSLAVMWCTNVARIAALVLIGSAGYPDIAVGGFHSSAGWIAFTGVSLAFVLTAQHLPWLARRTEPIAAGIPMRNPAAAWLIPLLMVLSAGIVSGALSKGFEWLYPLRFVAAIATLWYFRREYKRLDWSISWFSPLAGTLVFAIWIGFDSWMGGGSKEAMGHALAGLPAPSRFAWLAIRIAAAVTTVPIAEELAFRGYGMRRLAAQDFECVDFRTVPLLPVVISSLLFGLLHGGQWLAGTLAGAAYAFAVRRRGSIGDAVAAHATTNALLAAYVVTKGAWGLW